MTLVDDDDDDDDACLSRVGRKQDGTEDSFSCVCLSLVYCQNQRIKTEIQSMLLQC